MQPVRATSLPLAALAGRPASATFEPGAVVVRAGARLPVPMVVESGAVAVWAALATDARAVLEVLGPGDPICPTDERLELVALTRSVIRPDRAGGDDRLPGRVGALHRGLARALCLRAPERVLDVLRDLSGRFGTAVPGGRRIDLPLSQDLLAAIVGATRETVNRAIRALASQGAVVRVGRAYVVLSGLPGDAISGAGSSADPPDRTRRRWSAQAIRPPPA
jgi:CRP-like cAMP-binding protein